MLCLTRKPNETIVLVVGDEVIATIHYKKNNNSREVKFGFEANEQVKIYRSEVWEDIQRDKANGKA